MDYALITEPTRPHYGETGRAEVDRCFIIVWFSDDPEDLEVYFADEVYLFSVHSPSITSPIFVTSPELLTTVN